MVAQNFMGIQVVFVHEPTTAVFASLRTSIVQFIVVHEVPPPPQNLTTVTAHTADSTGLGLRHPDLCQVQVQHDRAVGHQLYQPHILPQVLQPGHTDDGVVQGAYGNSFSGRHQENN